MKETWEIPETYEPSDTLTSPEKDLAGGWTSAGGRWSRREGFRLLWLSVSEVKLSVLFEKIWPQFFIFFIITFLAAMNGNIYYTLSTENFSTVFVHN